MAKPGALDARFWRTSERAASIASASEAAWAVAASKTIAIAKRARLKKVRVIDRDLGCAIFSASHSNHGWYSNALYPNRPSQNEYRKRVPVRLHQISVIAKLCATSRRDPLPLRNRSEEHTSELQSLTNLVC